jgi:hypothetical protein
MSIDWSCRGCKEHVGEYYMVHDEVWLTAYPDKKGFSHFTCLEERIGRKLTLDDFTSAPVNIPVLKGFRMALESIK